MPTNLNSPPPFRLPPELLHFILAYLSPPEQLSWDKEFWRTAISASEDKNLVPVQVVEQPADIQEMEDNAQSEANLLDHGDTASEDSEDSELLPCGAVTHLNPRRDLFACTLVSREWHHVARSYIFRDIMHTFIDDSDTSAHIVGGAPENNSLSTTSPDNDTAPSSSLDSTALDVKPQTFSVLHDFLVANPGISASICRLTLRAGLPDVVTFPLRESTLPVSSMLDVMRLCPQLQDLRLIDVFFVPSNLPGSIDLLPKLKSLCISTRTPRLESDQVAALLRYFSAIDHVHLDVLSFLRGGNLDYVVDVGSQPTISSLRLRTWNSLRCTSISRMLMNTLTSHALTSLQIDCLFEEHSLEWQDLLKAVGPTLKVLCMSLSEGRLSPRG